MILVERCEKMESLKNKLIDPKVLIVLTAVGVFAGWEYLLLLTVAVYLLSDNASSKQLLIKTLVFMASILIFSYGWQIIKEILELGIGCLKDFMNYLVTIDVIDDIDVITSMNNFLFTPLTSLVSLLSSIIGILILVAKFCYVAILLTGTKKGFIFGKIDAFTTKIYEKLSSEEEKAKKEK